MELLRLVDQDESRIVLKSGNSALRGVFVGCAFPLFLVSIVLGAGFLFLGNRSGHPELPYVGGALVLLAVILTALSSVVLWSRAELVVSVVDQSIAYRRWTLLSEDVLGCPFAEVQSVEVRDLNGMDANVAVVLKTGRSLALGCGRLVSARALAATLTTALQLARKATAGPATSE